MVPLVDVTEQKRLNEAREAQIPWKKWGPYLSERQWGTVREDYSDDGNAWDYFTHDQARSRAYRWGEDGLGGLSDDKQRLCFALALWNERDPILKERLFGLTNSEANHGEDVKEYYFYLDSTPTHSYMKYLYKYPQREYPYRDLIDTNRGRSREEFEYELLDTGAFGGDRYFDVFVEYAKEGPEDVLVRITVHNRGPEAARLRVLPTLWFRNTWSWGEDDQKPSLREARPGVIQATHQELGEYWLLCDGASELLFTENESNASRLWGQPSATPYVKDAFHEYIISGRGEAITPAKVGTKAAAHYVLDVPAGGSKTVRLRLAAVRNDDAFGGFDKIFKSRIADADEFYDRISPTSLNEDERRVHRQALAGMLWSKQYYYFDLDRWLQEHKSHPLMESASHGVRNTEWFHMLNADVISMPDKWEYPWYAAWDLAFHCIPLALVDSDFAKEQLTLMLREWYMHPNGQIPAYEWAFGDVNPPVHAWAAWRVYKIDEKRKGKGDRAFLQRVFHKLMLKFTWWVNRKDAEGMNIFQGGFLGLDNIGVFDRSAPLPTGGYIEQSDGTSWMAMYTLNLLAIALELAKNDPVYEDMASKFWEHFIYIAHAMSHRGQDSMGLWNEEDGFFYDVLKLPDGTQFPMKIRSIVGLIPLFAVETLEPEVLDRLPGFKRRLEWFIDNRPDLTENLACMRTEGMAERRLLSIANQDQLRSLLKYMLDEREFLSPYGIRALSQFHRNNPYTLHVNGNEHRVDYEPGESSTGLFGGNSNWRGPIWFPTNYLLVESLQKFHHYLGDDFKVEFPTGSGKMMNLWEVAGELSRRMTSIFLQDERGRRPVFGNLEKFQADPHWRDLVLFHEYFHGDSGAGVGASHQTGWTGVGTKLMQQSGESSKRKKPEQAVATIAAD